MPLLTPLGRRPERHWPRFAWARSPAGSSAAEAATSPYLKGYKDFLSGVVPPEPGVYVRNDLFYYSGDIAQTAVGGRVAVGLHEWFVGDIVAPTVVTPYKILGGTYAFNVSLPFLGVGARADVDTARLGLSRSELVFNIGDISITPVVLGWHAGNFHWNLGLSVVAPTGLYRKGDLAFTSLNYWTVLPQFALTYFDPASGWDVSAAVAYAVNTKNQATQYLTGNIFDLDWAVGKQLTPAWKIGIAGYYLQQVTGDSGSGAVLGANQMSVWALGPAATYSFEIGQTPVSLLAKWTHEIAASRTFQGDTVTTAFSLKF